MMETMVMEALTNEIKPDTGAMMSAVDKLEEPVKLGESENAENAENAEGKLLAAGAMAIKKIKENEADEPQTSPEKLTLVFGGDMSVGENAADYFRGVETLLAQADFRMAQLEEPYVSSETEFAGKNRTTAALAPLVGKFDLLTLSGNHFYDFGERGVADTVAWCRQNNIVPCGGGINEEEARKPGFVEKNGLRVGVLAYNAVGPKTSFAGPDKGGCAYVDFTRGYIPMSELNQRNTRLENDTWALKEPFNLSEPCMGFNFPSCKSYDALAADVAAARAACDVLLVYFHKGLVHQPARLADYERFLSHVAIDNGADAVMATHSHVARGIEMYKGRAIYHGLNNFIMWTPQLSPRFQGKICDTKDSDNAAWIQARVKRFGFVPDPDYPTYPFHPESVYCYVAKLVFEGTGKNSISYRVIPMKVECDGVPYVHGDTPMGQECLDYLRKITEAEGLNTVYRWDGDEIVVSEAE
jgi:poly-gamma-glutamate capsule biosynthesis protein CapA/YwtB (metallophosphatase superfamily)